MYLYHGLIDSGDMKYNFEGLAEFVGWPCNCWACFISWSNHVHILIFQEIVAAQTWCVKDRLAVCFFDPIVAMGDVILQSLTVHDLIYSATSSVDHITRMTRACYFHIHQLPSIRRFLTVDSWHALVQAIDLSPTTWLLYRISHRGSERSSRPTTNCVLRDAESLNCRICWLIIFWNNYMYLNRHIN